MKNILRFQRVQSKQENIFFSLEVWTETDKMSDTIITIIPMLYRTHFCWLIIF